MPTIDKLHYETVGEFVSIFQRGRWWHANCQINGRQQRVALKTTNQRQARRKALEIEQLVLQGKDPSRRPAPTVAKAVEDYMAHLRAEGRSRKTLVKYKQILNVLVELCSQLGIESVARLDLTVADAYRAQRVAGHRAAKTIYTELVIVRQLVNFVLSRRLIAEDPLAGIRLSKPRATRQPCWSPSEMDRIVAAATEPAKSCFVILRETGMRVGELAHLTWEDLDFDHGVIQVRSKEWTDNDSDGSPLRKTWTPKTGDQRAIPLSPSARTVLEKLPRPGRWVVCTSPTILNPKPGRQISDRWLLRQLKGTLEILGLPGKIHTFRHSFISHALAMGTPESIVREWVGHVDREILRTYTHVLDNVSQEAMRRLSAGRQPEDENARGQNSAAGPGPTNREAVAGDEAEPRMAVEEACCEEGDEPGKKPAKVAGESSTESAQLERKEE